MEEGFNFIPLLIVVGLAALAPVLLARFKAIPVVVGEILAGILIGKSGLGLVHEELTLELLAEIGFAFLMFLSGLEINFSILFNPSRQRQKKGLSPLWTASLSFVLSVTLAILFSFVIVGRNLARDPWMMALILSTTSLGIVVPVLKERDLHATSYGQSVMLAALLADFLTMFLITVYVALLSSGLTFEILLIGVLFVAFLVTYRLGLRQIRRPAVQRLIEQISGATSQFKVRTALALMMAFVDLEAIGYGFFIPVFFIMVGVGFDFRTLLDEPSALYLASLLLIVAVGLKMVGALAFKATFTWRETLGAGSLLSARLSLIIAASAIGLRMGVISDATNAAIILIAALTAVIAPLGFNGLLPSPEETGRRHYLIFGAANIGMAVAQELRAHGEEVCFAEPDQRLAKFARKEGFMVVEGRILTECFDDIEPRAVKAILALNSDDDENFQAAKSAFSLGIENVVALVNEPTRVNEFTDLGAQAFAPSMLRPKLLTTMARNPSIFRLLTSTSDDRDIREFQLFNPGLAGKKIGKVVLPGDTMVLTISRNGDVLAPHATTTLEIGDRLTVLGNLESLEEVRTLVRKRY
jgi:Kef-type K+ transport system membrane component KefB